MSKFTFTYKELPVLRAVPILTKKGNYFKRLSGWFSNRKWVLEKNFYFTMMGVDCVIPRKFVFDGASVPRFFWFVLHPTGILMIPGLIHDFGYKYRYLIKDDRSVGGKIKLSKCFIFKKRKRWDYIFKKVAIEVNGFRGVNMLAHLGVRSGGWLAWRKHRKKDDE